VIALVDYGAGNLSSVRKALSFLGAEFASPATPDDLSHARAVVVPGVGHFAATRTLDAAWRGAIRAAVDRGAPLLGICLGMQWLFAGSEEAPGLPGLGLFDGRCTRLPDSNSLETLDGRGLLKVPHVGWNGLARHGNTETRTEGTRRALMDGVADNAQVYFTHSYIAPVTAATVAVTTYGVPFAAALQDNRIAGVQFHPEKSGEVGLQILRNWLGLLG
jgi:glutamine amidotransferase